MDRVKHLVSSTQGDEEKVEGDLTENEREYLNSLDSDGWDMLNINYAAHHRERILKMKSLLKLF